MLGLFRTSPTPSDNIRYGMTRRQYEDMGKPSQVDGFNDFLAGLTDGEREYYKKHGNLVGFKEE